MANTDFKASGSKAIPLYPVSRSAGTEVTLKLGLAELILQAIILILLV